MLEYLIVALIVGAALFFTVRRFASGKGCGCGHSGASCTAVSGRNGQSCCCDKKTCGQ